ncbi:MAG TPA: gephyrin-like molybdotransferase Glp [Candidatus Dormibacteraeota bacterium]
MLTVAQARERILARIRVLESEDLPLLACRERVLAEEVRALRDVPPFPNSAMDGYAVRAADVRDASAERPVRLRVVGEVRAGEVPRAPVERSTALRIMTGATIPEGSDAVVRVEDTEERDGQVEVRIAVPKGMSVRAAGSDLRKDDVVATAGRLVTPGLIGVLASAGKPTVRCVRQPRVAIMTTGDELRDAGEALGPAEITNTNRYSLSAALLEAGAAVLDAGVARDDRDDLVHRLESTREADLVVTTGGVSMGAYDLVRSLLEERDAVDFWQVALRPGKPLIFGTVHGVPLIGLPGNPVSALVGFELFVRPAVRKMQGRSDLERPRLSAITEDRLRGLPTLEQYLRGVARREGGRLLVRLTGDQGSHVLRSMADANCLVVVAPMAGDVEPGQGVDVIPLVPIA